MARTRIDRDQLRVFVRRQDAEALLVFLDRAIDLLPETKLARLVEGYARADQFRPTTASPAGLLEAVQKFHAASLRGDYYEDFRVDSRNFMSKSRGTQTWIAEYQRLTDLCVAAAKKTSDHVQTRAAFDLLFDLLRQIDEGRIDIIFFADEGGAWQVGVDWRTVLSAWFGCLAKTSSAEEYAVAVRGAIKEFASFDAKPLLEAARRVGTKGQRAALTR